MEHVDVHIVGLQALEAGVDRFGDMLRGVIGRDLRAEHDAIAASTALQPAADDFLRGM